MCIYIYVYIHIHIYDINYYDICIIYIYIYTCIYVVRHGNRQDISFMASVVDNIQRLFLWFPSFLKNGFRRRRKHFFCMVSVAGLLVDPAAAGGSKTLERIERLLIFCVFRTCFRRWFLWFRLRFCYGFRYVFYGFRRWIFGGFCRRRRIQNFRTYRAIAHFLCF